MVEHTPNFEEGNAILIGETVNIDLELGNTPKIIKVGINYPLEEIWFKNLF